MTETPTEPTEPTEPAPEPPPYNTQNDQYEELLTRILIEGTPYMDRTGTGCRGIFGAQLRYDLSLGFPLITTKYVNFDSVVGELLWFLSGSTNAKVLKGNFGVGIWDEWADPDGNLGPIYGAQWRSWGDHTNPLGSRTDQILQVIESLSSDPFSRRHIVSAWNVSDIPNMALAPCHALFQFNVTAAPDGTPWKLNCQLYQRSADMFLGVPFNIASYALLTHMIAAQVGLEVGEFIWAAGDAHIYDNHHDQVTEQIGREEYDFPTLSLSLVEGIDRYLPEHIRVEGYNHWPAISAPVAI